MNNIPIKIHKNKTKRLLKKDQTTVKEKEKKKE